MNKNIIAILLLLCGTAWGSPPVPPGQQLLGQPWLSYHSDCDYTSSLLCDKAASAATYTGATAKTFLDFEGVLRTAGAGEIAEIGARRVENLADGLTTQSITVVSGREYQVSMRGNTGDTVVLSDAATGTLTGVTGSRIAFENGAVKTAATTTLTLTVTGALTSLQVEDVTGQSNQYPAEEISNGVKYFDTLNGNTVDGSGVVTTVTGAAIAETTLKGIQLETAATNNFLGSEELNLFTQRGSAVVTVDQVESFDGTLTFDKVVGLGGRGIDDIYKVTSGYTSGTSYIPSFFVKKITGSGTLVVGTPTGSPNGQWDVNLALVGSGIERITRSHPAVSVVTPFVSSGSSGGLLFYAGSGPIDAYIGGMQTEESLVTTSYIKTTTAQVTRTGQSLTMAITGNLNPLQGAFTGDFYFDSSSANYPDGTYGLVSTDGNAQSLMYIDIASGVGTLKSYDGTNTATVAFTPVTGNKYKLGVSYGNGAMRVCADGTCGTVTAFDGAFATAADTMTFGVDMLGTIGVSNVKGIKNIRSSAQMEELTQ